uniref:Peptidase S1 domain-containing protein n=1 Tax=Romanomermis culicivorax TaxID=13658 RepID=A0A915KS39_ROMCU
MGRLTRREGSYGFCGAFLVTSPINDLSGVSSDIVLTAAHCVPDGK